MTPLPLSPCKNSSDLYQFQERPLAKVGWTCPPCVPLEIFIDQRIEFYLDNTMNLRRLTRCIMSCYTHKMAGDRVVTIDCVTSLHTMYITAEQQQTTGASIAPSHQGLHIGSRTLPLATGCAHLLSPRGATCRLLTKSSSPVSRTC